MLSSYHSSQPGGPHKGGRRIYIYIYILSVRRNDENVSFPFLLKRFLFVSLPFLSRFFTVSFSFLLMTVSFPFPSFLFRFFSYFWWGKEEGARSREQGGSREDRGFPSEPKDNFSKHSRARDDHSALFHVIWESMGRFLSQLEASPFLFRFQNVSLSFLYRFF